MNKSDSDEQKNRSSVFQEKINRGDSAEVTDRQTVITKKRLVIFFGKNRGDTLNCRPG